MDKSVNNMSVYSPFDEVVLSMPSNYQAGNKVPQQCVIVEDDKVSRLALAGYLKSNYGISKNYIHGFGDDFNNAHAYVIENMNDIAMIFLDSDLRLGEHQNGIDLAKLIHRHCNKTNSSIPSLISISMSHMDMTQQERQLFKHIAGEKLGDNLDRIIQQELKELEERKRIFGIAA